MKIMVNGTERELTAIGNNGIEWTNDLLGNYDALHYDEDTDSYVMSEDEFDWWEPVVEGLNKVQELENELLYNMDKDTETEYMEALESMNDLDDKVRIQIEFLENYKNRK